MNYIVLDLEWNQSDTASEEEIAELPFEIIEIGAIKLNEEGVMVSEFNEIVKPSVYHQLHHITSKLIHMQMSELLRGQPFPTVAHKFLDWCGQDYIFCTWGTQDLTELQRNLRYHNMKPLADGPIAYLDVQKLFSIAYEDRKIRRSLEYAVDYLQMDKDIPFHRAFSDAYYTAGVFAGIKEKEILRNVSYDVFHPPVDREAEIRVQFDTYTKYISREFADKKEAFADKEVSSTKCYYCYRNLRKKMKWFSLNGRHYYSVAYCEKHGYLKAKVRIHKSTEERIFVVKTTKFISAEDVEKLESRRAHAKEIQKKKKDKQVQGL